ncbi:hypothetical protein BCV71DRAFT_270232 [Rhizopus microsporus]|uniref:Tyr recombinase domain-containing protein n=1 Tax=Rhizopus microsporus TaxID=58291 RepID=A0A1X0RYR6_RHIZD|nr:hypothetical protein BCV71DRAFT_270232 [Rhizopus microsporus]
MHYQFGYSSSTLRSFRPSILAFHQNKVSLDNKLHLVNNLLDTLARRELPKQSHRPTIGISPTLNHLRQISTSMTTPLPFLQKKQPFLLAMAAFLRPSDLHRIVLQSAVINDNFQLTSQVVFQKKKKTHDHRRIIKSFTIFLNQDRSLCPVRAFIALRNHPSLSCISAHSSLFVNSRSPQEPLATSIIPT